MRDGVMRDRQMAAWLQRSDAPAMLGICELPLDTGDAPMSTRLDALLKRIPDPQLADQLRAEFDASQRREFGLVFEHHLPEMVELPGLPIRPGVKVRILPKRGSSEAASPIVWRAVDRNDDVVSLVSLGGEQATKHGVSDLVRVADFADPIYPGIKVTEIVHQDEPDRPWHALINAENFHALQALRFSHAGAVDTIYIDPPYNTGSDDWIYNDRHVAAEDGFRHSKWLSFMERRLTLAKQLLKPTGVIIVAIGDDEHHRLRMLLDQVFNEANFIADVAWQGGGSSLSRFHAGGLDYMLVYGRDMEALVRAGTRWKVAKEGLQDVLDAAAEAWTKSGQDAEIASRYLSSWWTKQKSSYDPGLGDNVKIDHAGIAVKVGDLSNSLYRPNLKYPVTDPATGIVYDPPENGWRFKRDVMEEMIRNDRVLFGARPRLKTPLADMSMRSVVPSFYKDRRSASLHLEKVLGGKRFPNPKDHTVLMKWIGMVTPVNGTVLDFFGGSGSTLEAVLRLNAADGGSRQCLLVTNNEVGSKAEKELRKAGHRDGDFEWEARGVCEYVTKPRVRTILTGIRSDGSRFTDTVAGNVAFMDLTYEDPMLVELDLAFARVAPLLWLAAGARGPIIDQVAECGWQTTERYGVLFRTDAQQQFLSTLDAQRAVFIVTDDEGQFQQVASRVPSSMRVVRLYESYLRTFQIGADLL